MCEVKAIVGLIYESPANGTGQAALIPLFSVVWCLRLTMIQARSRLFAVDEWAHGIYLGEGSSDQSS